MLQTSGKKSGIKTDAAPSSNIHTAYLRCVRVCIAVKFNAAHNIWSGNNVQSFNGRARLIMNARLFHSCYSPLDVLFLFFLFSVAVVTWFFFLLGFEFVLFLQFKESLANVSIFVNILVYSQGRSQEARGAQSPPPQIQMSSIFLTFLNNVLDFREPYAIAQFSLSNGTSSSFRRQ